MLIKYQRYELTMTINGKSHVSRLIFLKTTKQGDWLVFEDEEIYYWGEMPMTEIRVLIPQEVFPSYTFKSFGFDIHCDFKPLN
jgi:hypothetical protein